MMLKSFIISLGMGVCFCAAAFTTSSTADNATLADLITAANKQAQQVFNEVNFAAFAGNNKGAFFDAGGLEHLDTVDTVGSIHHFVFGQDDNE